jgi:histidine triad (HIT) family protein
MDCLFCKISAKEISAEVIHEDEQVFGFLDQQPISLGHTLVVPKSHAENIIDLPPEIIAPLFSSVKKLTERIKKALNPNGFTIGINHGRNAGQAVDHLHVHIVPRFAGDKGGSIHTVVTNPPKESVKVTADKIRSFSKI